MRFRGRLGSLRGAVATVGALLWVSVAGSALAQMGPATSGGYYPEKGNKNDRPALEFDIIGQIIYDSNVARSSEEVAQKRGLTPQDGVATPGIKFDVVRPAGKQFLYIHGNLGYDFYIINTILNRPRININGGTTGQIGLCQDTLDSTIRYYQRDLAQQSLVSVRNAETNVNLSASATCGQPIGFAPTASVSQDWIRNSNSHQTAFDSNQFTASPGLSYRQPSLGNLTGFFRYSNIVYPNRGILIGLPNVSDSVNIYAGGAGFQRALGRITGGGELSYSSVESSLPGSKPFQGLTWSVDLSYKAGNRLQAHALFERSPGPSNRAGSTFVINTIYNLDGSYELNRRMTFNLGASARNEQYGGGLHTTVSELNNQTIYNVFGSYIYRLNRRWSADLHALWERRDANVPGLGYSDERVGITLTAGFGR